MLLMETRDQMQTMKFGVATADITPPVGVKLWGYNPRPSESIGHRLRAEALACEDGTGGGWILIGADIGAFSKPLSSLLQKDIGLLTGLPPGAVMLTATHTHSGPHVTDALWREQSDLESDYFRDLRHRLTDMAERAWHARLPGELVYAQTEAPTLGSNRRARTDDGTWINVWSDPEGKQTGYFDAGVDLLGVRREDGVLSLLLVNYGCHPVCFGSRNLAISADYAGYLKDALEENGDTQTVLFTVSGHANVDPRHCVQDQADVVRRMGEELAAKVRQAIPLLQPVPGSGASGIQEPWTFNTTWNIEGRMLIYFPHYRHNATVETCISAVAAGDCVLLGMPGETVSEYRGKFRERSPFGITLLVSLANDFIGYLPTDEILEQGAYEACMSPLNPIEDALTERADAALKRIHRNLQLG